MAPVVYGAREAWSMAPQRAALAHPAGGPQHCALHPWKSAVCRPSPRSAAMRMAQDGNKEGGKGDELYFATKISTTGNYKLLYELTRNQLLLLASCVWTLSVIDPTTDPTFFARTVFDTSLSSLVLGAVLAAPLVAGGYLISRSESRLWTDINAGTQQLALRLFGGMPPHTAAATRRCAGSCARVQTQAHTHTHPHTRPPPPTHTPAGPAPTQARRH